LFGRLVSGLGSGRLTSIPSKQAWRLKVAAGRSVHPRRRTSGAPPLCRFTTAACTDEAAATSPRRRAVGAAASWRRDFNRWPRLSLLQQASSFQRDGFTLAHCCTGCLLHRLPSLLQQASSFQRDGFTLAHCLLHRLPSLLQQASPSQRDGFTLAHCSARGFTLAAWFAGGIASVRVDHIAAPPQRRFRSPTPSLRSF